MAKLRAQDILAFKNSGGFDAEWYSSAYPDVSKSGMDPAEHYLWLGAKLGRSPLPPASPPPSIVDAASSVTGPAAGCIIGEAAQGAVQLDAPPIEGTSVTSSTPYRVFRIANGTLKRDSDSAMQLELQSAARKFGERHGALDTLEKVKSQSKLGSADSERASVVVVIPFYNGSSFIERSVQSVLDQTVQPTEFIVVDDGSNSKEAAKLDQISQRMGFCVLRKKNGGQGSARNAGVAATNSDFICFLDQDDFFLKNHIETLLNAKPDNDPHFGWVYGELFEAEGNGDIIRTSIVSHHSQHPKTHVTDLLRGDMFVLPSASLIARNAYDHVGGFDEQFMGYEDDDLFLRLFRAGFTNYFTEKAVTVWCIHAESTSYGIRMARSRLAYFKKLVKNFPDDKEKQRFFIRDLVLPRFHNTIMGEAIAAVSELPSKYKDNREEYLAIAQAYVDIVVSLPSSSPEFRNALENQMDGLLGKPLLASERPPSSSLADKVTRIVDMVLPESYVQQRDLRNWRKRNNFDPAWYLQKYPDVAAAGMDPFRHFIMHGRKEGRLPSGKGSL